MKMIFLLFLLSLTPAFILFAQKTGFDSTALKTNLLKKDIRHFYLNKQDWKAYKKQHFKSTSDYFKPNAANVSNPDLLKDSVYVKAYRNAALKKAKQKRTILQVELIGGIIAGALALLVTVVFVHLISGFN